MSLFFHCRTQTNFGVKDTEACLCEEAIFSASSEERIDSLRQVNFRIPCYQLFFTKLCKPLMSVFFFIAENKPTLELSDLESHHSWSSFLKGIVHTKNNLLALMSITFLCELFLS